MGLAAPQLGLSIRAFVVQGTDRAWMAVNPEILRQSRSTSKEWEACLSLPHYVAVVERPRTIRVRYNDIDGRRTSRSLSGQDARVFQHELDHLDGILFTDRADLSTITHECYLEPAGEREDTPSSFGKSNTAPASAEDGGAEADGQWELEEEYDEKYDYEEYEEECDESEQQHNEHRRHSPEHTRPVRIKK
jgi:hypothetical protein